MSFETRLLIACLILLLDSLLFFLPLTALFLVYILIWNPPWFRSFLDRSQ